MTQKKTFDQITGNLTRDPERKTLPGREKTVREFNPVIDGWEDKTFTTKPREVTTYGIAVNGTDAEGNDLEPVFFEVTDWNNRSDDLQIGDFVRLTGYGNTKQGEKDGEPVTYYNFSLRRAPYLLHRKGASAEAA